MFVELLRPRGMLPRERCHLLIDDITPELVHHLVQRQAQEHAAGRISSDEEAKSISFQLRSSSRATN